MSTTGTVTTLSSGEPVRLVEESSLGELFAHSPDLDVRTAASAVVALVSGLASLGLGLFSRGLGLGAALAALALLSGIVGLARASRPLVAGGRMAAGGLVCALLTGCLVLFHYLGVHVAVADPTLPTLRHFLDALTRLLPHR